MEIIVNLLMIDSIHEFTPPKISMKLHDELYGIMNNSFL